MVLVSIAHLAPNVQSSKTRSQNADQMIVVREEMGKFYYFTDYDELIETYSSLIDTCADRGGHPSVHEVITPSRIQRARFDLDVPAVMNRGPFAGRPVQITDVCQLIDTVIAATCAVYHMDYHPLLDITKDDFVVTSASGTHKFSYHIMTPVYCNNVHTCQQFTQAVILKVEMILTGFADDARNHAGWLFDCIDQQVTKTYQDFRMPFSCKVEAPERPKLLDVAYATQPDGRVLDLHWTEMLIGWYEDAEPLHFIEDIGMIPTRAILNQPAELQTKSGVILDIVRMWWANAPTTRWAAGPPFDSVWELRAEVGRTYYFKRLQASYCHICRDSATGQPVLHEHDNTLFVTIGTSTDQAPVYYNCRRAAADPLDTRIKIGTLSGDIMRQTTQDRLRTKIEDVAKPTQVVAPHRHLIYSELRKQRFDTKTQILIESKPELSEFPMCRTLYVRAAMKMGKTAKLIGFLQRAFSPSPDGRGTPSASAVYISFRQTFSEAIVARLNQSGFAFESYSQITSSSIDLELHPLVVVQVESLARLRSTSPTVLILDEVESVLSQFTSPFVQNVSLVYALFQRMVREAKYVVCMDANLSDRTLRLIEGCRGASAAAGTPVELGQMNPRFYYENNEPNAREDHMYLLGSGADLYRKMFTSVRDGKKVVLCSSSLDEAKCIMAALMRDFDVDDVTGPKALYSVAERAPDADSTSLGRLRVGLYTAETSPTIKQQHFSDVNRWWGQLDVLIYTPTVTAGVSFDIEHFDIAFGIFTSLSCDVETCRQMMGRIRRIRLHEYYVHLQVVNGMYPTDRGLVTRLLMNTTLLRESRIMLDGVQEPIVASVKDGAVVMTRANYFDVVVENIIFQNRSRNDFGTRFIDQMAETGIALHYDLDEDHELTSADVKGTYNKGILREVVADRTARQIEAAAPLPPDQYKIVSEARIGNIASGTLAITADDMIRARKTMLMMLYIMFESEMTYDWLRIFNVAATIEIFKNYIDFGAALAMGLVPTKTLSEVSDDTADRGTDQSSRKSLRHWFVARVLHHLEVYHLGDGLRAELSFFEEAVEGIEADLKARLQTRRSNSVFSKLSVWSMIHFEFDMPGRKSPRQIIIRALQVHLGIVLRVTTDLVSITYPDAIARQATLTYERLLKRKPADSGFTPDA